MRIVWCATHHQQMKLRRPFCGHKDALKDGCQPEERVVLKPKE